MKLSLSVVWRTLLVLMVFAGSVLAAPGLPSPELDPGSMASAMTLLVGGFMILRDRGRRK